MGIARVVRESYPDPTTSDERWTVVDLVPEKKLDREVTLKEIKEDSRLSQIALVRQSRLSVMPLKKEEFDIIISLSQ